MTMTETQEHSTVGPVLPAPLEYPVRLRLLGRSVLVMITSLIGVALFTAWVVCVGVSPITVGALLLLPITGLTRAYANAHRRDASRVLSTPIPTPYRSAQRRGVFTRVRTILLDPASWRDALWLLAHSVVGFVTATLTVTLFVSSVFYLIYPFLFWVTPQRVFGTPFGGWFELHSVAQATVMLPFALLTFSLWLALQLPLSRVELVLTRSLLRPRASAQWAQG
jgi:hypothetical protein